MGVEADQIFAAALDVVALDPALAQDWEGCRGCKWAVAGNAIGRVRETGATPTRCVVAGEFEGGLPAEWCCCVPKT